MKTSILYAIISMIILFSACSKENENLPPFTPPQAKDSSLFKNNTSEVYYSEWLSPESRTNNNGGGGINGGQSGTGNPGKPSIVQFFTINSPAITQTILDKGVVLAYCRLENENNITRPLPTTVVINGFASTYSFSLSIGKLQFMQTTTNPAGIAPISGNNKFRYVIIPPSKQLRLSKPLSEMSYAAVCNILGIAE